VSTSSSVAMPSRHVRSAKAPIGLLLYLAAVGIVGAATIFLFIGSGLLLLAQPGEQIHSQSDAPHFDAEIDPSHSSGPLATAENAALSRGEVPTPSLRASETAFVAAAQIATPLSPSDTIPGTARAAAALRRSARHDRRQDPEAYAADSANQQEYDQLHTTGSAVRLSSEAPSR
jgi:hypothetical protein